MKLRTCGHGIELGGICLDCRCLREPESPQPRDPQIEQRRESRWPEFLSRWSWPSDAGECIE